MKKTLTFLLAGLVFISLSCKKEEAKPNSGSGVTGSSTISGTVKAETDNTNSSMEKQSGVTILATYNGEDLILNPVAGQTYPDVTVSAVTDANGHYSLTIPNGGQPVSVVLKPQDFLSAVQTSATTSMPDQLFTAPSMNVTVSDKEAKIININY